MRQFCCRSTLRDRENSIKLYASNGVSARTGDNYDLIGLAWQYRWAGGL